MANDPRMGDVFVVEEAEPDENDGSSFHAYTSAVFPQQIIYP